MSKIARNWRRYCNPDSGCELSSDYRSAGKVKVLFSWNLVLIFNDHPNLESAVEIIFRYRDQLV